MPSTPKRRPALLASLLLAAAPAMAADFWVDGLKGADVPAGGTQAQPWKTIGYALAQMTAPAHPDMHLIHVVGGQAYDQESLPLVMRYNVRLQGDFVGTTPPVIRGGPAAAELVRFDPGTVYNRKQSGLEYLVLEGGQVGAAMGGRNTNRHRPEIYHCWFRGQAKAAILIDQQGMTICDPRFFDCEIGGDGDGVLGYASGSHCVLRPDMEECRFLGLAGVGYRLEDRSLAGSDVGGLVRYCWFQGCTYGMLIYSGANAMNTRLDVVSSHFARCREDGVHLVVNLPADPAVTVESCSFLGGKVGLRVQGAFTPGLYTFTVRNNVAAEQSAEGFLYDFDRGPGAGLVSLRVISQGNLARGCGLTGHFLRLWKPDLRVVFDSLGDRALGCGGGFYVQDKSATSAASVRIESGIFAGNLAAGLGLQATGSVEARFLTLADNGGYGLDVALADPARCLMDHCILAANTLGEIQAPSGFPVSWSVFQTTAYPGPGNSQADPRLQRPFYKLAPGSPCVDAGDGAARTPPTDYEGDPRVVRTKPGGIVRPDLGADEYVPTGSARLYGVPGFGYAAFHPVMATPNTAVQAGGSLRIELKDALDFASYTAQAGILFLGTAEEGPLFDLGPAGAPGSFLWQDLFLGLAALPVDAQGMAAYTLGIPGLPELIGATFTAQWLAVKPYTNAAWLVATQGLRFTIGQ